MRDKNEIKEIRSKIQEKIKLIEQEIFERKNGRPVSEIKDEDFWKLMRLKQSYRNKVITLTYVLNEDSKIYNEQFIVKKYQDLKPFIFDYDEEKDKEV